MIKIVAKCTLKEGMKKTFIEQTQELIRKSQNEEGCISYDLYEDIKNENIVTYIEEWKDQAAIDAHGNSEHYLKWVPLLNEFKVCPTEVSLYKIIK